MKTQGNPIQIIQGGQWGSEAKGAVAAYFAKDIDIAVRTGATNAGHTVYYNGKPYKMQQLPVGWVNPRCQLVIGAGAIVDLSILSREIEEVNGATGLDIRDRLFVDPRAYLHLSEHAKRSAASGRHHNMGATGKGCSEALVDRIMDRGKVVHNIGSMSDTAAFNIRDTEEMLNGAYDEGARIQLEGTQGSLLDLNLGPYPYTTHASTQPARWLLEAGLSPTLPLDLVLVFRTYPIRVAGNSGPMPFEMSWIDFMRTLNAKLRLFGHLPRVPEWAIEEYEGALAGVVHLMGCPPWSNGTDMHTWSEADRHRYKVTLSEAPTQALKALNTATADLLCTTMETTTVTKKVRRIAQIGQDDTIKVLRQTRPSRIVLTFMNYIFPQHWNDVTPLHVAEGHYIHEFQQWMGARRERITHISRGPLTEHIIEVPEEG